MSIGEPRRCESCGATFSKRAGRYPRFCSTRCRMRAHRRRQGIPARTTTTGGRVLREVFDRGESYLVRFAGSRGSLVVRKRGEQLDPSE